MKQKDLAREYALARIQGRLSGNEVSFSENKVFTEEDIEAAFEAGAEWADEHPKNGWHTVADEDWPNNDKDYLCYNGIDVRIKKFSTILNQDIKNECLTLNVGRKYQSCQNDVSPNSMLSPHGRRLLANAHWL